MILKRKAVLFLLSFASLLLGTRSELVEVIDLNANWSITNQNLSEFLNSTNISK